MTVQEPSNEGEWITFVSPLVRIVEEKETSTSSPSNSRSAREGSSISDDPKGKRTMSSETLGFEIPEDSSAGEHGFGLDGPWNEDLDDIQEDPFNALMDFSRNK
jgi:hypothetical protein